MPETSPHLSGQKLRFRELFRLSLRTFRVKPVRAVLTIAGMSVGIGTVLFLVSLGYGLQYILIGNLVTTQDSLITMEASYPSEANKAIDASDLASLQQLPNVKAISPEYEFPGEVGQTGSSTLLISTDEVEGDYFRLSGITPDVGKGLVDGDTGGIVVTSAALKAINMAPDATSLGKPLALTVFYSESNSSANATTTNATSVKPLTISGIIVDDTQPPMTIVLASSLSTPPPFTYKVLVEAKDITLVGKVRDELIARGFVVNARIDLVNQAQQIMNTITLILGVFGITALFVSAIGMFNTMIVGFMERTYEVGILKSLGATDADVRNLFLVEAFVMGLLGGVGGIALGYGAGQLINFALNVVASKFGGKPFTLFITPVWFVLLILGLSTGIGLLSGFWPARRASQLSPKEAFVKR